MREAAILDDLHDVYPIFDVAWQGNPPFEREV